VGNPRTLWYDSHVCVLIEYDLLYRSAVTLDLAEIVVLEQLVD
jgi:hypothetical protein